MSISSHAPGRGRAWPWVVLAALGLIAGWAVHSRPPATEDYGDDAARDGDAEPKAVATAEPPAHRAEPKGRATTRPVRAPAAARPAHDVAADRRAIVMAAIPRDAESFVVLDAAALFSLPLGKLFRECLERSSTFRGPTRDLDAIDHVALIRLANGDHMSVMSGDFARPGSSENARANELYAPADRESKSASMWKERVWVSSSRPEAVADAVARMEGTRADGLKPAPTASYGDLYGRVDAGSLARFLPPGIAERVAQAHVSLELHADVADDLQLTLDATSDDEGAARELGEVLSSSLQALHSRAAGGSDPKLAAELTNYAVHASGAGFQLDATLSAGLLGHFFAQCGDGA